MGYFGYLSINRDKNPEDFKNEVIKDMDLVGSKAERQHLKQIFDYLHDLTPHKISSARKIMLMQLYASIVNLWTAGKLQAEFEASEYFNKRMKSPKRDPRFDSLFPLANYVYSVRQNDADGMRKFLHRNPDSYIPEYEKILKGISYNQALSEANGNGGIIPKAEFHEREIEIQNAYKQWRSRTARR